jgi:acetyl esterase
MSPSAHSQVTAAAELDPEIEAILEGMAARPAPPFHSLSPDGARQSLKGLFPKPDDPEPVGEVMDFAIGDAGIPIRVYVPDAEGPYPTLVYFHGGGWVVGDVDTHDSTCRALAAGADCLVVSVDYRRAPEHTFPVPLEDCYTAATWVFETAEEMRIDTTNVAIGGDSAGGNLAAAVAQLSRDRDGPSFARQVLIYPVTNHSFDTASYEENAEGYFLTKADMEWFWDKYLAHGIQGRNPYASPLRARHLEDLPPATVVTCGYDPLRDEGAAYAARLADADVDVNHIHYDDAIHGILQLRTDPVNLSVAHELVDDLTHDLRATFE